MSNSESAQTVAKILSYLQFIVPQTSSPFVSKFINVPSQLKDVNDCQQISIDLYHATSMENFQSILTHGLRKSNGRLGYGVYCSDSVEMCVKFIKYTDKLKSPIIIKLQVNIDKSKMKQLTYQSTLNLNYQQVKQYSCVKSPYFKEQNYFLYQWAIINSQFKIVSYSHVNQIVLNCQQILESQSYKKMIKLKQIMEKNNIPNYKQLYKHLQKRKKILKQRRRRRQLVDRTRQPSPQKQQSNITRTRGTSPLRQVSESSN